MSSSYPAKFLMATPFVRTERQFLFAWCLARVTLENLTSHDKMEFGDKDLNIYNILALHIACDDSGLNLARREDAMCFLKLIMSVITDPVITTCHQKAMKLRASEIQISSVILDMYRKWGWRGRTSPDNL